MCKTFLKHVDAFLRRSHSFQIRSSSPSSAIVYERNNDVLAIHLTFDEIFTKHLQDIHAESLAYMEHIHLGTQPMPFKRYRFLIPFQSRKENETFFSAYIAIEYVNHQWMCSEGYEVINEERCHVRDFHDTGDPKHFLEAFNQFHHYVFTLPEYRLLHATGLLTIPTRSGNS